MKRLILPVLAGFFAVTAHAQKTTKTAAETGIPRPKLVVGIVIDQMRWDYLYRFNPIFKANGGFKRLMGEGFPAITISSRIHLLLLPAVIPARIPAVFRQYMALPATPGGIIN
jgi:hypothetical protein